PIRRTWYEAPDGGPSEAILLPSPGMAAGDEPCPDACLLHVRKRAVQGAFMHQRSALRQHRDVARADIRIAAIAAARVPDMAGLAVPVDEDPPLPARSPRPRTPVPASRLQAASSIVRLRTSASYSALSTWTRSGDGAAGRADRAASKISASSRSMCSLA